MNIDQEKNELIISLMRDAGILYSFIDDNKKKEMEETINNSLLVLEVSIKEEAFEEGKPTYTRTSCTSKNKKLDEILEKYKEEC